MSELAERGFGKGNKGEVRRVPKEGELVLLKGENLPRSRWKIGIVQEARENPRDHKVRTVVVRTMGKARDSKNRTAKNTKYVPRVYTRSPSFLVPLEDAIDPI